VASGHVPQFLPKELHVMLGHRLGLDLANEWFDYELLGFEGINPGVEHASRLSSPLQVSLSPSFLSLAPC
jgi:hypothetical protein